MGNISYFIEIEHRGNGYALEALKLLSQKLYSDGIKEIYISTYKNNVASIKTAKKFGGIESSYDDEDIIVFNCNLSSMSNNNRKR